jgi:hypothetical protein
MLKPRSLFRWCRASSPQHPSEADGGVPCSFCASLVLPAGPGAWIHSRFRRNPAGVHIQSLAVLPLENLSGDPSQNYFANGITDGLITALAKINSVKVIPNVGNAIQGGAKQALAANCS